jgi:beta-mannosidase
VNKYILIIVTILASCSERNQDVSSLEINDWSFLFNNEWYNAEVPGNNFSDLLSNSLILDPFYGTNEDSVQWVAQRDWKYRTKFTLTEEILARKNQYLIFHGMDTYSKVFLNDSLILQSDNMFRVWEIDVTQILQRNNFIEIIFESVVDIENEKKNNLGYNLPGGNRVFTRKAGFHYGWDWGPKISPVGLWRKVELLSWNDCRITNTYIIQNNITDSFADITVNIEIESIIDKEISIKINDRKYNYQSLQSGINQLSYNIHINNPELWWPNGYGSQKLYDINVTLYDKNKKIDFIENKIGLRDIDLICNTDTLGESFLFRINNKQIFMKGANYIPQDNLQNRVTSRHYRELLLDVVNSNMNMIRVWGGGIYEEDIFYHLCDSLGILVWQDFMFACAMYPSDSIFIDNVRIEAIQNVKRLANHPCLALWCGNNENSEGWHRWGWQEKYSKDQQSDIWNGYEKVFKEILPNIVKDYSQISYWESSPKFGRGDIKHQFQGDSHYWGVWHDSEPFENFENKVPRFMSEFGFQSFPQLSTISSFSDSSQWNLNSNTLQNHQKHPRGNQLILEYMSREYNTPRDFKKFIYTSQILQANGIRIGLEAHRRNQPYCMGTLYWQLNDCWPAASWSSRDYFGNWKALQYATQDVFSTISLSIILKDSILNVWVMSDLEEELKDTLEITVYNLDGVRINQIKNLVNIKKDTSNLVFNKEITLKEDEFVVARLNEQKVISRTVFKNKIKDIKFNKPTISFSWNKDILNLNTDIPAFEVFIHGVNGHFEDNYFTLFPGQEKSVKFDGFLNQRKKILIWSLYDLNTL